jgi:tRNA A-37 threonylcarbamoyl transferase component Bud32
VSDVSHGGDPTRYRLDARIATGGMGEVWRATDEVLGRQVAVKLLKTEYADDATFRSRFETEARNAAALHHPNVAAVFDFGERPASGQEPPRPYLVMELVRGEPLSALLRGGQPMPADTAVSLVAQAADGLAAAHALGIVHRDVKPANLLVTPDRTVKITDFGIARAADAVALTRTGQVVGTPQYLSPEQAQGLPATPASDVYSLGVVLYECLAGRRPFDADSPIATALAHLREPPPPLADSVPAWLRETVEVALAKDPEARFASAHDFAEALRGSGPAGQSVTSQGTAATRVVPVAAAAAAAGAAGTGVDAVAGAYDDGTRAVAPPPDDGPGGTHEPRRRTPGWVPWAGGAVAVLVAVALVAWLSNQRSDEQPGSDTTPTPSATASATATRTSASSSPSSTPSSSAPAQVQVTRSNYLGRPADDVRGELEDLGLKVAQRQVANPDGKEQGTVADLSPSGRVPKGSTITLSVLGAPSSPSAGATPSSSPTSSSGSPTPTGSASSGTGTGTGTGTGGGNGNGNGGGNGNGNGGGNGNGNGNGNGGGNGNGNGNGGGPKAGASVASTPTPGPAAQPAASTPRVQEGSAR